MCIASFVFAKDKAIITFNRDENRNRPTELAAWRSGEVYDYFCPLDKLAHGTWIGTNKKIIATLQNGSLIKHLRNPPYSKSRGLVLKYILETNNIDKYLNNKFLKNVEPFTISILNIQNFILSIYRFDGVNIEIEHSSLSSKLICSSTLYSNDANKAINFEFQKLEHKTPEKLFEFNQEYTIGKPQNKYTNLAETVSITQFIIENNKIIYSYFDPISHIFENYEI